MKKKARPRLVLEGPVAIARAKNALGATTIPALRALGFEGTFPAFRRIDKDRHIVVAFWWGRSQSWASIHLGVVPPRDGTTAAQDLRRVIDIRNRQRTGLDDLIAWRDRTLFFFDTAAKKWGARWADGLAEHLKKLLETKGMAWLLSPARRPGRGPKTKPSRSKRSRA